MPESHVLVVEDDDTIRNLLAEYLKAHSYLDVDCARDGVEALHKISTGRYAVVVLDVMMPKMSGVDLLDSLGAMASDPSLPSLNSLPNVLVMTSATESVLPNDAIEQKLPNVIRGVFRKPLDIGALAAAVEKYM